MKSFLSNLLALLRKPAVAISAAILSLLCVAGLVYLVFTGYTLPNLKEDFLAVIEYTAKYPILIYLALVLIGGLPLPLSPVIVFGGVVYTERYGLAAAVLICYSAMVINMIWTYFLSAYPMRRAFESLVAHFTDKIPEIPDQHKSKVPMIIRITPGIPFFIQNYFLGVSKVPFVKYLLISMAIQIFYTTGFVVSGGAIFQGKGGLAIAAISLLLVFGIVVNWIRSRSRDVLDPGVSTESGS